MTPRRELPDTGIPDEDLPDRALLERIWSILSRWAVPVMMSLAYVLLVATSDTNTFGTVLMATGLVLVLVGWFVFRALTESAGLSRALSVGDVAHLIAIAERRLPRARKPAVRARLLVARALGLQLRGDHAGAVTALDAIGAAEGARRSADRQPLSFAGSAPLPPELAPLAVVVRRAALIELGRATELRAVKDESSSTAGAPDLSGSSSRSTRGVADTRGAGRPGAIGALATLADGQLALATGDIGAASSCLARVADDIRAGSAARAMAHLYAARIADTRGDSSEAARHRAAAAALASPDASWLRPR